MERRITGKQFYLTGNLFGKTNDCFGRADWGSFRKVNKVMDFYVVVPDKVSFQNVQTVGR